jgi:hypothetical protein
LLQYPKNRNSLLHEMILLSELPFLIFMLFKGATILTCLMLPASLVCTINCQKCCLLLWLMLPTSLKWEINYQKCCPLIWLMLPTSIIWEINCQIFVFHLVNAASITYV